MTERDKHLYHQSGPYVGQRIGHEHPQRPTGVPEAIAAIVGNGRPLKPGELKRGSRPNAQGTPLRTSMGTAIREAFAFTGVAEQWTVVKFPGRLRWAVLDANEALIDVGLTPSGQWTFNSSAGEYSQAELEQIKTLCKRNV